MERAPGEHDALVSDHCAPATRVMSRIGRNPISIPKEATVTVAQQRVSVRGPKGAHSMVLPRGISATVENQTVRVQRARNEKPLKALHGLTRALIANMVSGVVTGYTRELEIVGVGYRAQVQGKRLSLTVGFSHPVVLDVPEELTVETPKPTVVVIRGSDKQRVGQFAADVHRVAPPEPYKGTGIKYAGEIVRRKAGKAATGTGAKAGGGG